MTTQKGFKRRVRARMAKTGERYAAARRALMADGAAVTEPEPLADGYRHRGGLHPETAGLAAVLANGSVTSPLTGLPLSEALVLVAGGGLGAGYILWEFESRGPVLTLGFINRWQYPGMRGWFGNVTRRLGLDTRLHETSGARTAASTLDGILDRGEPAIAYVDQQEIGTWGQPDRLSGSSGYPVVVFGRGPDGGYLVDDRGRAPLRVAPTVMARARARIASFRHRLIELRPEPGPMDADRLRSALRAGLDDQIHHLSSPSDSFSLPAWRKWARLMTDQRNPKAWPRVFAGGAGLLDALLSVVEGVDGDVGAGGGHLRDLYADGLVEAAAALELPALADAAAGWRVAADLWQDLADAAVPADLAGAAEAMDAAEALHAAVMDGEPGRTRAGAAARRLWETRARYASSADLGAERIAALLSELGARLAAIHVAETDALAATARAIGR